MCIDLPKLSSELDVCRVSSLPGGILRRRSLSLFWGGELGGSRYIQTVDVLSTRQLVVLGGIHFRGIGGTVRFRELIDQHESHDSLYRPYFAS